MPCEVNRFVLERDALIHWSVFEEIPAEVCDPGLSALDVPDVGLWHHL